MMESAEVKLDFQRHQRLGISEAVLCAQKSPAQIGEILDQARAGGETLLLTRLGAEKAAELAPEQQRRLDYDPVSETAFFMRPLRPLAPAQAAVVTAGTSDAGPAREAIRTLEFHGLGSTAIFDVGVAGIWRLMDRVDEIKRHPVVIALAGMDAAMPTVLGGLVPGLLIAVPTSTGYGVALNGETAFAASLASCAPGVMVCNIDNGYGAACAAIRALTAARMVAAK
ncbi:MAG: nickel pincer cofactor biosynthesis protein LarB [Alphaproteobacteria bacterium]|jgi:hypothetical protein|nr:nickel pincer cofactor biosynthesis protein LarB [Alphaproteobacteria bacterium]